MVLIADATPALAGTTILLTTLALLTSGLRIYCRLSRRSWGVEDWIMTVSWVPFCVLVAGCLGGAFNGIGARDSTLAKPGNEKYQVEAQKFFLIFEVGYCSAIIPIKLSIGWMLIRVAEGRKVFIYVQYLVMALFVVMNTIALIFILINCVPVEAAWDPEILKNGGHCQPSYVLANVYYACTAINILTDWITAFLPVPLLWNVHLDRNTKISVSALMGLGIFASLSACIRLKYTVALTSQTDFLFEVADVVIWGFAENGIGMMVGNIATLRPLFSILRDRSKTSDYKSHNNLPEFNSPQRLGGAISLSDLELESGKHRNHVVKQIDHTLYSSLSDGESQKDILENVQRPGQADIVVSQHIVVAYE